MAALANEPQSIGRVLDSGFKLFVKSFTGVLPLSLAAAALLAVPNIANVVWAAPTAREPSGTRLDRSVLFLVALPIYMILIAAVVYRARRGGRCTRRAPGERGTRVRCVLPRHRRSHPLLPGDGRRPGITDHSASSC